MGETGTWSPFNIADHHNQYFSGTDLQFSNATVAGTGGSDETTGYMGLLLLDKQTILICYDRTTSHLRSSDDAGSTESMAENNVFCLRLSYHNDSSVALV